jgi:hypothetical protein
VTVFAGGHTQRRFVGTGGSYLSQSELNPLVFGLGAVGRVDSLFVRWPGSGRTDRLGPLDVDTEHTIQEEGS